MLNHITLLLAAGGPIGEADPNADPQVAAVLLVVYLLIALGVSFICSLMEASLLTVPRAHAEVLRRRGKSKAGDALDAMKRDIDRPLGAILTLNTFAHTIGAAGVGAQSLVVFGATWVTATSLVLTLLVLYLSEIVPKTIGATYARALSPLTVSIVRAMIVITFPLIIVNDLFTKLLKGGSHHGAMTREQLTVIADLARSEGVLHGAEAQIVRNAIDLVELKVEQVMTPRTVVFMLKGSTTISDAMKQEGFTKHSRIPVFGENSDNVKGLVHRYDVYEAARAGFGARPVQRLARTIHVVPETATLLRTLQEFAKRGAHLFLVVDEYGGTAGVVTLEDVLESILGAEIVDETDPVADMRELASGDNPAANEEIETPRDNCEPEGPI
ncbi:MAG: CNNM domain-containing protein [Planctomycetota bacterium]